MHYGVDQALDSANRLQLHIHAWAIHTYGLLPPLLLRASVAFIFCNHPCVLIFHVFPLISLVTCSQHTELISTSEIMFCTPAIVNITCIVKAPFLQTYIFWDNQLKVFSLDSILWHPPEPKPVTGYRWDLSHLHTLPPCILINSYILGIYRPTPKKNLVALHCWYAWERPFDTPGQYLLYQYVSKIQLVCRCYLFKVFLLFRPKLSVTFLHLLIKSFCLETKVWCKLGWHPLTAFK